MIKGGVGIGSFTSPLVNHCVTLPPPVGIITLYYDSLPDSNLRGSPLI